MCICVTDSAKIEEADNDDDDGHDGDANDDHGEDDVGADAGGGHCCSAGTLTRNMTPRSNRLRNRYGCVEPTW